MGPRHRLFGIDREALQQEMVRRELAHHAKLDRIEQEIGRQRVELNSLHADEQRLQALSRHLQMGLVPADQAPPPAIQAEQQPAALYELQQQLLALGRVRAEIQFLRITRARIVDQMRQALLPHLAEPSQDIHRPPPHQRDAKEAANAQV